MSCSDARNNPIYILPFPATIRQLFVFRNPLFPNFGPKPMESSLCREKLSRSKKKFPCSPVSP